MTAIYSVLHMFVDGVCAFAMFGTFLGREQGYRYVLFYNFCAFALQMPFGAVLDLLNGRCRKEISFVTACMGVAITLIGAFMHPVVLGVGNALFHIGGGVGTIHEDKRKGWRGRGLGVFVAPGAFGLYLGMQLAKNSAGNVWLYGAGTFMALICAGAAGRWLRTGSQVGALTSVAADSAGDRLVSSMATDSARVRSVSPIAAQSTRIRPEDDLMNSRMQVDPMQDIKIGEIIPLVVCLFLVVVLRSYIGMAVTFSWKTTVSAGVISTLAVVFGKAAGGFLASKLGFLRTAVVSLSAAAVFYLFSGFMPAGALALFLFNMTMPITLYLLIRKLPGLPGFSFGFLTFGLFLGFLPTYFGLPVWRNGSMIGCVGSVISLLILAAGIFRGKPDA